MLAAEEKMLLAPGREKVPVPTSRGEKVANSRREKCADRNTGNAADSKGRC